MKDVGQIRFIGRGSGILNSQDLHIHVKAADGKWVDLFGVTRTVITAEPNRLVTAELTVLLHDLDPGGVSIVFQDTRSRWRRFLALFERAKKGAA